MDARIEQWLYRNGAPLPIHLRRELGLCKWGHADYVTEDLATGKLNYEGLNVGLNGTTKDGTAKAYCRACHRAEVKASKVAVDEQDRLVGSLLRHSIGSGPGAGCE